MTTLIEGRINDRWSLLLTPDRVEFHAVRPKWETGRLASCSERMEPGMTVFDVGAECGDFSALYKSWVGPEGDVLPVEPQPAYWPSIRATWEANGYDPPSAWFPGFAGDETTVHEFGPELAALGWPAETWPTSSTGPVIPDVGFKHLAQQASAIPQVRLDALSDITGVVPDAIVMDIEGAEWHALAGCEYLCLGDRPPLIWVSVHEATMADWYGTTLGDIHNLMEGYGYSATELPYNGEAETFWFFEPR